MSGKKLEVDFKLFYLKRVSQIWGGGKCGEKKRKKYFGWIQTAVDCKQEKSTISMGDKSFVDSENMSY